MLASLLERFARWALSRNAPGNYLSEDDSRWAYTISTQGRPYLTRVLAPWGRLLGVRPYLHHFHRDDGDQPLHNHPWRWGLSIVLCGSYDEERFESADEHALRERTQEHAALQVVRRRVRWVNWLTHEDYHRVTALHGEVWTLFITGPRLQDWGFFTGGRHVPHAEYLGVGATRKIARKLSQEGLDNYARLRLPPLDDVNNNKRES